MRWWQLGLITMALCAVFRFGCSPEVVTADEVDALSAGVSFASAVRAGAPLQRAFATDKNHPRAKRLRRSRHRQAVSQGPTVRWTTGLMILAAGPDTLPSDAARWAGALWMALATLLLWLTLRRGGARLAGAGVAIFLLSAGAWEASSSFGAAAVAACLMAALCWGLEHLRKGRGAWIVAVAWGLLLGVHPGALFLLVPIFVAAALWLPRSASEKPANTSPLLRLPEAPLALYLAPIVGLIVLVAMWPTLWSDTGKHLGAWLIEAWREPLAPQMLEGGTYDQALDRSPPAWSGLVQWLALLSLPILLAWLAGVYRAIRIGREGRWAPIVLTLTWLSVAGMNGGLWGGRLSILSLLWVPTAITAADGVDELSAVLAARLRRRVASVWVAVTLMLLIGPALRITTGAYAIEGAGGLASRVPIPVGLLRELAARRSGDAAEKSVSVALWGGDSAAKGQMEKWRYGTWVLAKHAGLKVALASPARARWLVAVGAPIVGRSGRLPPDVERILRASPEIARSAGGLAWGAYPLR